MKVWKYELVEVDVTFDMPSGATLLHVDVQAGQPCLWASVDPDRKSHPRRFRIVATGEEIDAGSHVGTYMQLGYLMFHVFEVEP